ncbi:hypothetical protein GCM10023230_07220 [Flavobacterium hankyongi]|uniref:Uncharacterized protein n=2 Tax=Flavobacteriaceae TaxID=49546 RepID=A0ABP8ZMN9_9FLAO
MRAPEFLEKEKANKEYVSHPEAEKSSIDEFESIFLQASNHVASGITKRKSLNNASNEFLASALKKRESLYQNNIVSQDYYDFAMWLTKNRTTLSTQEIKDKTFYVDESAIEPTQKFQPLDEEILIQLWDNLFYQIITYKSGYIREAILSILVADFFLKNQLSTNQTNEDLRKLAQARVVIPKVIFEKEDINSRKQLIKETLENLPLNAKELDKELDIILLQDEIESRKKIVTELKTVQRAYNKQNQKAYDLARKAYETTVSNLYANAETVEKTIIDPITNQERTVTDYVNLNIPAFEFEKEPELNVFPVNKTSSGPASEIEQLIALNEFETFDELITNFEETINQGNQYILENIQATETMINANGIILPVVNTSIIPSFTIGATSTIAKSPLTFLFNDSVEQSDIVAAQYKITFDDETFVTDTSFTDSIINNKLSVKVFLNGLNYFDKTSFIIEGYFTRSNGTKIKFSTNGSIIETILGGLKIIPESSIITYNLKAKGKYSIKPVLDSDDNSNNDDNTSNNDGSVLDYIPSGFGVKQVGIVDYRKVEQEVCCYVPGEVSHIENIMASEYKDRTTRSLQRREETNTSTTEKETEKLTDTTTSNRFEMNQEISSLLAQDDHFGMNSNFQSNWGTPKTTSYGLSVGADFATNTTKEESNNQAVTMAKDVTERALDRIVQKVKEERIVKVTNEFEETNTHGFDNRKNTSHISGVYRWIDKVYRNQVINYGKRLIYEFMIPEPAAFHKLASTITSSTGEVLTMPIDPRSTENNPLAITKISDLDWTIASHWAKQLNAIIEENPEQRIYHPVSFSENNMGIDVDAGRGLKSSSKHFALKLPEKYQATYIQGHIAIGKGYWEGVFNRFSAEIAVGETLIPVYSPDWYISQISTKVSINLQPKPYVGEIPVSVTSWDVKGVSGSLIVTCELTPDAYKEWQIKTFNAIISAYEQKLAEYNQKLKQLKSEIKGTNPGFYREVENTVLRKNCIEYLNSYDLTGIMVTKNEDSLTTGNTASDFHVKSDSPELEKYAARVKFFEQAFEWNLMSYNFYPMYWGEKGKLQQKYNVDEYNDPIFRAFLQSGMARVMVTVRPGFEEAVNWYMNTGQIWNGGQVPTVSDPLFLSIVDELRETNGEVEETWETRVPTSLTVIQAGSIGLEVEGLPCDDDCDDYKLFDSDGQPVLDGNGNPISTNPIKQNNGLPGETQNTPPIVLPDPNEEPSQEV